MTRDDANRALSLLAAGEYRKVDTGHVVHLAAPKTYLAMAGNFFRRLTE